MMVAFVLLPIRPFLIAVLISYWNNPWALAATMILEGIGAGVYDTMLPIIVKKMTQGSGRFGFTFGFIVTCWRLGHGLSVFFGEAIVHSFGYTVVFIVLACMGLLNLLVFTFFYSPYSTTAEKKCDSEIENSQSAREKHRNPNLQILAEENDDHCSETSDTSGPGH